MSKRNPVPRSHDVRTTRHAKQPSKAELMKVLEALTKQIGSMPDQEDALPPEPPVKVIPEDQIQASLKLAEASMRTYGEIIPPREVFWAVGNAECPNCHETKPITSDFGFKTLSNGKRVPQSWCRACRNGPASHPGRARKGKK